LGSKGSELVTGLCKIIHLSISNKISHRRKFMTKSNTNYRKSFKGMFLLTCCSPQIQSIASHSKECYNLLAVLLGQCHKS